MSNRDYVIQVEDQNFDAGKIVDVEGAGKPSSRRTSTSSQHSLPSCTSPNYDSGNFSCSNTSDFSNQPASYSSPEDDPDNLEAFPFFNLTAHPGDIRTLQRELKDKEKALNLSLTEAKKMRSELERLTKSEKWYKTELKNQKKSKLELLEKLYLNERKFVKENQKLKSDYARMCTLCEEIESRTLKEKDSLVKQLQELHGLFQLAKFGDGVPSKDTTTGRLKFQLQKQNDEILEKETLIDVLKKQKQGLLDDLSKLTNERDSKIISLEANFLTLEDENRKITKRCISLVEEKRILEEDLKRQEKLLEDSQALLHQKQLDLERLREHFQEQLGDLDARNGEVERLKSHVRQLEGKLKSSQNPPEILQLLESYKKELDFRNSELQQHKSVHKAENDKIARLQVEILELESLRESYEYAKQEIEQLKFQLQEKDFEIENLRIFQSNQVEQISKLQEGLAEYQRLRENFDKYVNLLQTNNEALEVKESEIEDLKQVNEVKIKEVEELKNVLKVQEEVLSGKEADIKLKNDEIENLKLTNEAQFTKIDKLESQIKESVRLHENLLEHQVLLEKANKNFLLKEEETKELKSLTDVQSKQIANLTVEIKEITKLREKVEELNKLLSESQQEVDNLRKTSSSQSETISSLNKCQEELNQLRKLLDRKNDELQKRDLEIETLKLILKGQKAQIRRFNLKCYQNEELQEKINESSNWIRESQNVIESEAEELRYLREITQEQAKKLESLLHGGVQKDVEKVEDGVDAELLHNPDFEAQMLKIERLKTLLDEKSSKISQLNDESEYWMDLLKDLKVTKGTSCATTDRDDKNKNTDIKCNDKSLVTSSMEEDYTTKSLDDENSGVELRSRRLKIRSAPEMVMHGNERQVSTININASNEEIGKDTQHVLERSQIDNLVSNLKTKAQEFENHRDFYENELAAKEFDLQKLRENIKNVSHTLELQKVELNAIREDHHINEKAHKTQLENLHEIMENSLKSLKVQLKGKQDELEKVKMEKNALIEELISYKNLLERSNSQETNILDKSNTSDSIKNYFISVNSLESLESSPKPSEGSDRCSSEADWKILRKVMETEHKKKISRYEVHIRTLLENVKSYKKNFESMETKYKKLVEKHEELEEKLKEVESENEMLKASYQTHMERITAEKLREINTSMHKHLVENCTQSTESFTSTKHNEANIKQLQEIAGKYQKSQKIIAVLKHQLETARKQFLEMDDYKRLSVELKLNLTNIMDDYKKLLHPLDNYKLQSKDIDAIYNLINRSNNFVPNLNNLSSSIELLRDDIKKFSSYPASRVSPFQKMSLMDELKAADTFHYS